MAPNCPGQRFFGDYKRFTPGGKLGLSVVEESVTPSLDSVTSRWVLVYF